MATQLVQHGGKRVARGVDEVRVFARRDDQPGHRALEMPARHLGPTDIELGFAKVDLLDQRVLVVGAPAARRARMQLALYLSAPVDIAGQRIPMPER